MNEFWNALLTGLAGSKEDKYGWLALPIVLGILAILSFVFNA